MYPTLISPVVNTFPVWRIYHNAVQFSRSDVSDSLRSHGLQHSRPLSITNSWSLLKLMSIKSLMPSIHLILCRPLLLLPSVFPSIRVFSNESALHIRWPKYWSFSFSISPSIEHSGLISFRVDWLDLLAVQGTLKSLLQHHSSKASIILWRSAFLIVQLSHPYTTPGKTIALTRWDEQILKHCQWLQSTLYAGSLRVSLSPLPPVTDPL